MKKNTSRKKVDIDKIMEKIRAEIEAQSESDHQSYKTGDGYPGSGFREKILVFLKKHRFSRMVIIPFLKKAKSVLFKKKGNTDSVNVGKLLKYEDEQFLTEVYRSLFYRLPKSEGLEFWLYKLREENWEKINVLREIRNSDEGKIHNVRVKGLKTRYFFHMVTASILKLPIFGYVIKFIFGLFRFPSMHYRLKQIERKWNVVKNEMEKEASIKKKIEPLLTRVEELERRITYLDRRLHKKGKKSMVINIKAKKKK